LSGPAAASGGASVPVEPLSPEAVRQALTALPGWSGDERALRRTFRFATFADAIAYLHACVPGIDALNHHPEWTNVYDRVSVVLRTHDAGDRVTAADLALARHLEAMAVRSTQR